MDPQQAINGGDPVPCNPGQDGGDVGGVSKVDPLAGAQVEIPEAVEECGALGVPPVIRVAVAPRTVAVGITTEPRVLSGMSWATPAAGATTRGQSGAKTMLAALVPRRVAGCVQAMVPPLGVYGKCPDPVGSNPPDWGNGEDMVFSSRA